MGDKDLTKGFGTTTNVQEFRGGDWKNVPDVYRQGVRDDSPDGFEPGRSRRGEDFIAISTLKRDPCFLTNSVDVALMDERGLNLVSDPLGNVAVNDTTCFMFRIDAFRTPSQNLLVLFLVTLTLQLHMAVDPI